MSEDEKRMMEEYLKRFVPNGEENATHLEYNFISNKGDPCPKLREEIVNKTVLLREALHVTVNELTKDWDFKNKYNVIENVLFNVWIAEIEEILTKEDWMTNDDLKMVTEEYIEIIRMKVDEVIKRDE